MLGKFLCGKELAHRRFAILILDGCHSLAVFGIPANGNLYPALGRWWTPIYQRQVNLLYLPVPELFLQMLMSAVILCQQDHAGGVLIQAMDQTWALDTPYALDLRGIAQYSLYQCSSGMSHCRVDHHPGWLIDHNAIAVLEKDIKGDVFGLEVRVFSGRKLNLDLCPGGNQFCFFIDRKPINGNAPGGDQFLNIGSG
jgi:hypothetical protein